MMTRRFFIKLAGTTLLAVGSGLSLADRAVTAVRPHYHQPPHNRHWNDPYTPEEVSYMKLGSNWCFRHGNRLKSL
jgi:hypothetical protein